VGNFSKTGFMCVFLRIRKTETTETFFIGKNAIFIAIEAFQIAFMYIRLAHSLKTP
jgi:hypothetical protein